MAAKRYQVHACRIMCVPNNYFKLLLGHTLIGVWQFRDNVPGAMQAAYEDCTRELERLAAMTSDNWRFSPLNPLAERIENQFRIKPYRRTSLMQRSRYPRLF